MHKGARFYRCDFQVHTPRDEQWNGSRPTSDDDRTAWARTLVAAARRTNLNAIAITDHHDTVMFRFVRRAAETEQASDGTAIPPSDRLIVFPGVELTLPLPCQAIVIFDADLPLEFLDQLPGALGYVPSAALDEKSARVEKLAQLKELNDIAERLDGVSYLKGRFIVLPHVQENGHKTILRAGFDAHYRSFRGVGGYVDGAIPPVGKGARTILDGRDANYGKKPLAVFQTSDSRRADFGTLGQHSTWIKWSRPTAEALRQSCLARQSRVVQSEPTIPAIAITRVEVSVSKFLGKLNLFLSPQFNALIGGRGTGKSTLLEYVRWALCVPTRSVDDESLPEHERRAQTLIQNTLTGVNGSVRVHVEIRGVVHIVDRRTTTGEPETLLKIGDAPLAPSSAREIRRLLPIEAYSQKQLSSIGSTTEDILAFVLAPVSRAVASIDDEIRIANEHVRESFSRLRSAERSESDAKRLRSELDSLTRQRDSVRQQLATIDPADAAILRNAEAYATERATRDKWRSELDRARENLEAALAALRSAPSPVPSSDLPDRESMGRMHESLSVFYAGVRTRLQELVASVDTAPSLRQFAEADEQLEAALGVARESFKGARSRASAHETAIKQIDDLSKRISEITTRLGTLDAERERNATVRADFNRASANWGDLVRRRGAIARERCDAIEGQSRNAIRGTSRPGGDITSAIALLAELARGSRISRERFESLRTQVDLSNDAVDAWLAVLDELRQLIDVGPEDATLPGCPSLHSAGFHDKELRAIGSRLDDDSWMKLRLTVPRDFVSFDYKTRDGEYIPFPQASAGQRATALMRVLLAEEGAPLIVDQPEDDLDNKIIHEIAADIWEAKTRRQIIFASHNANLVVNGDADLVVVFDYAVAGEQASGFVSAEGAIDDESVRASIADVMEGGRDAFRLRRDKYGF